MVFLYNLLLILILIGYVPHLTLRGKWHKGVLIQLGFWPAAYKQFLPHNRNIWIHAVSVGEVLAIKEFVHRLQIQNPQHQIVLSTVTRTGQTLAKEQFADKIKIIYAPFDFSWVVKKYIQTIQPCVYIAAETEIWPNLYQYLSNKNIPVLQINGRLSDSSFKGYQKIKRFIPKTIQCVNRFCMQTLIDQQRICALGADPAKVHVCGNLKFDNLQAVERLNRKDFHYSDDDLIWVAGSTHPGEEHVVLDAYQNLKNQFPQLKLILVPRHIERIKEVQKILESINVDFQLFSKLAYRPNAVLLVDTIGQLRSLYSLADVVFVGKTLIGQGGQNILEPAQFAKPIIIGPHMQNFRAIFELFQAQRAVRVVNNLGQLQVVLGELLANRSLRVDLGARAKMILDDNRGATESTLNLVKEFIPA